MKKIVSLLIVLITLLTYCLFAFADEQVETDVFQEAGTVIVEVDTHAFDSATDPSGALPATTDDISHSNSLPDKPVDNTVTSSRASWTYLSNYIVYSQTTNYNCGPACVQAALRYINGYAPSQSSIASGCKTTSSGTYLSNMVSFINSIQSENSYASKYQANSTNMKDYLYAGIVTYDAPPIIGMAFDTTGGWLYSSDGHFMSVYGAKSDKSQFALADPWIGYANSGLNTYPSSYTKSATTIFNAYNRENIGLMY